MNDRLQKILSQAGIASRRASERLMVDGRVTVNGVTVRELGTKADVSHDDIRVDGSRIKVPERHRYLLLNKPRGYVTTRSDPEGRPTVIDLLRGIREYVYPVGRLDFDSEGLLLLTNDGDLAARLTHPRHGVARVYEAQVAGVPDDRDLKRLAAGLVIDGRRTAPAEVKLVSDKPSARVYARAQRLRPSASGGGVPASRGKGSRGGGVPRAIGNDGTVLLITVHEGRNRQVRKMCEAIGHPVDRLRRVAIGPLRDSRLKPGYWRDLTPAEVKQLQKSTTTEEKRRARVTLT